MGGLPIKRPNWMGPRHGPRVDLSTSTWDNQITPPMKDCGGLQNLYLTEGAKVVCG
jgi:hypothetical protein